MVEDVNVFPQQNNAGNNEQGTGRDITPIAPINTQELLDKINLLEKENAQYKALATKTLPPELVQKSAGGYEELVKVLTAVIEKVGTNAKPVIQELQYDPRKYFRPESIDKEDWIDKPDVFLAYASFFVIGDDRRKGFPVASPYGFPIEFKLEYTKVVKTGKSDQILYFSLFKSHSKKVSEWLRDHSKFGVKFFEWNEMKDKKSYDKISKIAKWAEALDDTSVMRIKDMCIARGMDFYPDNIRKSKLALVEQLSDEELSHELAANDTVFKGEMMKSRSETQKALEISDNYRR